MSYSTWITYGYGVCVDDINTTPKRLLELAALDDELLKDVREYLSGIKPEGYKDEDLTLEDFDDFNEFACLSGIGTILSRAISDFSADLVEDYNGCSYVILPEQLPWGMREKEKSLTEKEVREIFKKYIAVLTDEPVEIGYQRVENGG